jgi:hypothetical protein
MVCLQSKIFHFHALRRHDAGILLLLLLVVVIVVLTAIELSLRGISSYKSTDKNK